MDSINWLYKLNLSFEKFKNSNILITGANGMIASDLTETLLLLNKEQDLNMKIYAMCRNKEKALKRFDKYLDDDSFILLINDVSNKFLFDNIDYTFHLASSANPTAFNETPVEVMKANFIGTMNVLEQIKEYSGRLIFVSSSEVYGENFEEKEVFTEDDHGSIDYYRFRACYPESKRAAETLCKCYEKEYDVDVVIARPAFIYGKNIIDDNNRADCYFLRQAFNHEDIVMYSKGEQVRSYCYVNDCISGLLYIALFGIKGEAYNIGDMNCIITLKDYAQKIADAANVNLVVDLSKEPNKVMLKTTRMILDTHKLESLGWKVLYNIDNGINDILGVK